MVDQYRSLGGKPDDHEILLKLIKGIPSNRIYKAVRTQLQREVIRNNKGQFKLEEVSQEIHTVSTDIGDWEGESGDRPKRFNRRKNRSDLYSTISILHSLLCWVAPRTAEISTKSS